MSKYIPVDTKVIVNNMGGEFTGTVVSYRDTLLKELNPAPPASTKAPLEPDNTFYPAKPDLDRVITLYTVKLDNPDNYQGLITEGGLVTVYQFIRIAEAE